MSACTKRDLSCTSWAHNRDDKWFVIKLLCMIVAVLLDDIAVMQSRGSQ